MVFSPVTLREVARHAGVHPGTASRALNAATRSLVNEKTAHKVLQAAADLGYRPNPIARGLKTNRSSMIGVLIPDLTNPLFPPIVRGIEDRLATKGYTAVLANSDNDPSKERVHVEMMLARLVEGFILATAERDDPLIEDAVESQLPVVLVNRTIDKERAFSVIGQDKLGSSLAVDHLVGLGHERIAHIVGPEKFSTGRARHEGFLSAMRRHGLEPDPDLIRFGDSFTEEQGAMRFRELLRTGKNFTAVFAGNDLLALGCYDVMADEGLSCPADISVIGYNDMPLIDKVRPPLTTIRVPQYEIGSKAAGLLLERLENGDAAPRTVVLQPELVVRSSTAPPAR